MGVLKGLKDAGLSGAEILGLLAAIAIAAGVIRKDKATAKILFGSEATEQILAWAKELERE